MEAVATFIVINEAHMNIFYIMKVKILVFVELLYTSPPPNMLTIELGMVIIFLSTQSNLF